MDINSLNTQTVKLTKLITNQYIIGKTTETSTTITIADPYMVIPDPSGIQLFPYDEAIIGQKLDFINVDVSNSLYCTEVGADLRNTYLTDKSGIESVSDNKLII